MQHLWAAAALPSPATGEGKPNSPPPKAGLSHWTQRRGVYGQARPQQALLRHDDEIRVPAGLTTKALIGDKQRGARGHQRADALKRFRREFDTVERVDGGLAQGIRHERHWPLVARGAALAFRWLRTTCRPVVAKRNREPADADTLVHRPAGGEDVGAERLLRPRDRDRDVEHGRKTLADEQLAELTANKQRERPRVL